MIDTYMDSASASTEELTEPGLSPVAVGDRGGRKSDSLCPERLQMAHPEVYSSLGAHICLVSVVRPVS